MRKRLWMVSVSVIAAIVLSTTGTAAATMLIPTSDEGRDKGRADTSPVIAKVDDHLVLGPPGLESVVLVHYAKPPGVGGGKKGEGSYKLLGAKWKEENLPVNYVIDPDNPDGLSAEFVTSAIFASAEEWDAHTSAELFENNYTIDDNASWDSDAPDGRNELLFENYSQDGVIAVTVIWGYFSGPPSIRKIIEFDILFDTDFAWGDAENDNTLMDLQNIATHEIGHGAGLADLYDSANSEQTMYGYSTEGETKKRDLNTGDIAGIQKLYGV